VKKTNLFIAGVVLLVIVLVVLLPVFLSSGWIQNLLLERANSRLPGTLSIGHCRIGWQQGLQCSRLSYVDTKQGIQLDIPSLRNSQGLLALLVAPANLGTIRVDGAVLVLPGLSSAGRERSVAAGGQNTPPVHPRPGREKSVASSAGTTPLWDRVNLRLLVGGTTVKLGHGQGPAETLIRDGLLNAHLATGSVHFKLDLQAGDGAGTATASGFVNLPARTESLLDTLVTEINLHIMDLQVEHFSPRYRTGAIFPGAEGNCLQSCLSRQPGSIISGSAAPTCCAMSS